MTMTEARHAKAAVVVVARHGERLDYVIRDSGQNWVEKAARPFDPPLTNHGKQQGFQLGRHLAEELKNLGASPISAIYSSPFLRCRQTAVAALDGYNQNTGPDKIPPVRVELGLAESINESWYRSWSLPGSNGTWGFRGSGNEIDPTTLHPASKKPVQPLLDFRSIEDDDTHAKMDLEYISKSRLDEPFCFYPRHLETRVDQRRRMLDVVTRVAQPGETVLVVSHGGPVTHLYEELTGNNWSVHGESSYCCYSIYEQQQATVSLKDEEAVPKPWKPLAVNVSDYLHEKVVYERHVSEDAQDHQGLRN